MEIWKDIPNYKGYQVSNLGNVRTNNKTTITKMHGIRHWKNRLLKQKITANKYGRKDCRVELWNKDGHKTLLVARLVACTFYSKPLNTELTVNHKDGNTLNNSVNNLELITRKENIQHGFKTGLYTCQRKIKITNKLNGVSKIFLCLNDGNKYINKTHSYLSTKLKNNILENDNYTWELI